MSENTESVAATETESSTTEQEAEQQTPKPTDTVEFWKSKAREQERRAKENADAAKRLADIEAANLTESEKSTRRIAELESQLSQRELLAVKQRVALNKGLPAELVDRLQGATEEELSDDADALLALVKAPTSPKPDLSQGARGGAVALNSDGLEQALRQKLGLPAG